MFYEVWMGLVPTVKCGTRGMGSSCKSGDTGRVATDKKDLGIK